MSKGRFIAVVGPSGVGKDSIMAGIKAALPQVRLVRRIITRPPGLGGEDYDPVSPERFDQMARAGAFCLHWSAHGLCYGIPTDVVDATRTGTDCLANLSRRALPEAAALFDRFVVLNITASPETLAARLAGRARETPAEIRQRLERAQMGFAPGGDTVTIRNDGPLPDAVASAVAALNQMTVRP
jgi:ribose 1,5-bisphosphokinase